MTRVRLKQMAFIGGRRCRPGTIVEVKGKISDWMEVIDEPALDPKAKKAKAALAAEPAPEPEPKAATEAEETV